MNLNYLVMWLDTLKKSRNEVLNKANLIADLTNQVIEQSGIKKLKTLLVGDYILEWHPNFTTKNNPGGVLMIFTKSSYEKAKGSGKLLKVKSRPLQTVQKSQNTGETQMLWPIQKI